MAQPPPAGKLSAAPSLRQLHGLLIGHGLSSESAHQAIHDAAAMFDHDSAADLTGPERGLLFDRFRALLRQGRRPAEQAPPRSRTASRKHPRGRPRREGVLLMISRKQCDLIRTIASELPWTADALGRWLIRRWGASGPRPEDLGTSDNGMRVIRELKLIKSDKRGRRRNVARPPSAGSEVHHEQAQALAEVH